MKIINTITLCCLLLMAIGCKNTADNSQSKEVQSTETNSSLETIDTDVVISKITGEKIGGFSLNPLVLFANGVKYTSKNKSDKHKFYDNGSMVYEVKLKSGGFKLRDKDSELLWKIKIYPDKIKISDNEENENPFEIKKYEDKIKIKKKDETLYEVKFDASSLIVNDIPMYNVSYSNKSYAYAILAIAEIPEDHRLFILAELLTQL